ncbi:MAG TPA: SURF1 family protein [Gammaproteobacteria bacterium]|nr:SURF1 family protein [Gammaproteobacteria bacterium]
MKSGKWRFHPTLWPTLAALVMFAVLIRLGIWQLHRADYKRALLQQYTQAEKQPPLDFNQALVAAPAALSRYRHVVVHGHYDAARQILLQDMQHDQQIGYEVLTPFVLEPQQRMVMVDRGWLSKALGDTKAPPLPLDGNHREIRGVIGILPVPGIRLGKETVPPGWPKILLYPRYQTLAKLYGAALAPQVILLDADQADGLVRDWRPDVGFPPVRHLAYALQWFALALALMVIWIVVNLKRGSKYGKRESD